MVLAKTLPHFSEKQDLATAMALSFVQRHLLSVASSLVGGFL
jgi:hypothetical protein